MALNIDVRWNTPFTHSLTFRLFGMHFTQLNDMYWSHVPVNNTIEKLAKDFQATGDNNPLHFFIIPPKNDHRVRTSFEQWKKRFRDFQQYTRLNMVLSLSSCFEVYLRSIVALALESCPGITLNDKSLVDGARLLKFNPKYRSYGEDTYFFKKTIDMVVQGEWQNRAAGYKKLFTSLPIEVEQNIEKLDNLRRIRNNIAHYFGRPKEKYEMPLIFEPLQTISVSAETLISYFNLIYDTAKSIDEHLYKSFIGSYEIIACYCQDLGDVNKSGITIKEKAKRLSQLIGRKSGVIANGGAEYYKDVIKYFEHL